MTTTFKIAYSYLASDETIEVTHLEPIDLRTPKDFDAYFDQFLAFWRAETPGTRVYILVNWHNFNVNAQEAEAYSNGVRRVYETAAHTIVRYGAVGSTQRIAGRLASNRLHKPAHIYATRGDALAVIRGLRAGVVHVAT